MSETEEYSKQIFNESLKYLVEIKDASDQT